MSVKYEEKENLKDIAGLNSMINIFVDQNIKLWVSLKLQSTRVQLQTGLKKSLLNIQNERECAYYLGSE